MTLESEAAIKEAREAYDALTEEEQALVTNSQTLADAEKTLADLRKEQQEKLEQEAKAVKSMIASLGTVTLKDEAAVLKARDAYERLSPQAKELVDNYGGTDRCGGGGSVFESGAECICIWKAVRKDTVPRNQQPQSQLERI